MHQDLNKKKEWKQHFTLSYLLSFFVLLGIFFLPFNSYEGIAALGEFSNFSSTIFFLLATATLFMQICITGKIKVPYKNILFQIVCLFILWSIFSSILNISNISTYYFKNTSGIKRFFTQLISLTFSAIIFLLVYYYAFSTYSKNQLLFKIRRIIMYSFVIVSFYTIIEILVLKFKVWGLEPILYLFNYFPFTEINLDTVNYRIASVTFETPAFGTYLLTIAGWMFSYIVTSKSFFKYIPAILVIVFALFSGSRSALFIIGLQTIIFLFFLVRNKKHQLILGKILIFSFIACSILFLIRGGQITEYIIEKASSFGIKNDVHAISNKSRLGIQYALGQVFIENPISGVGLGQQAFPSHHLYPKWATESNWEFRLMYLNPNFSSFPPGYNFYIRLLTESGLIGFSIFLLLLILIFYIILKLIREDEITNILAIIIFISMTGAVLNWFKMDTYRVFTFWIHLALLIAIMQKSILEKTKVIKNN